MAGELRQLEGERFDLGGEVTFLKGKLKQAREECDARVAEGDALKLQMAKASQARSRAVHPPRHRSGRRGSQQKPPQLPCRTTRTS